MVSVGALSSMPWLLHSELYDVITPVAATLGAVVGFILLLVPAQGLKPWTRFPTLPARSNSKAC